jgi:hypothetical protein
MAKSKKPVSKKSSAKAKPVTKKKSAAKKPATKSKAQLAAKKTNPYSLRSTPNKGARRPATNPDMPLNMIGNLQAAFAEIKADLEEYAACPKSRWLFGLRSLRYAQTPYINSWSFAIGKTPKLSGIAG